MNIEQTIISTAVEAVKALYGAEVAQTALPVQKTRAVEEGIMSLAVFPLLKISRKSPDQTATELGDYLVAHSGVVERYNVAKGFLNLVIKEEAWASLLATIDGDDHYGEKVATENSPLVMIEYSSPNTNKPLHLGHVRNNLLGAALARIVAANGNRVVKTNIVNDRGIHICKSMLAWQKWFDGATPESTGKKGDHLVGDCYVAFAQHEKASEEEGAALLQEAHDMLVKWEACDPEVRALWQKMNEWVYAGFDETYRMMGVSFDKIYYESETYLEGKEKVIDGLEKGLFYKREDGSVWANLEGEGLDEKLLLRSDGTSVYMTQDIGTAKLRFQDYPIDKMIYVVGNEQNYHFQVLSILLDKLGFRWGKDLTHFSYGMVELPEGKMKSREGTVVDADDLMAAMINDAREVCEAAGKAKDMSEEEKQEVARIVGLGALKYFILKVDARKNMLFDPKETIDFTGNNGPFLQYTHARIKSILRKAGDLTIDADSCGAHLPNAKEIELIQKLSEYAEAVAQAGIDYSPSGIANYCYELAKSFNQFYHDYSILNADSEEERRFRLLLAKNVAKVLKNGMALLGIELPERM